MNQTNFFISIFFVCILLWTYEYLWLPSEDYHTASENRETILQPVHTIVQNAVQIEQSAIKHLEEIKTSGVKSILPSWSRDTPIVFLHIGKAGGTSFDAEIPLIIGGIGPAIAKLPFSGWINLKQKGHIKVFMFPFCFKSVIVKRLILYVRVVDVYCRLEQNEMSHKFTLEDYILTGPG